MADTDLSPQRTQAWVTLNMAGVGPRRARKLVEFFGSPQKVLGAGPEDLQRVSGIGELIAKKIHASLRNNAGEREIDLAGKKGIRIITFEEDVYPFMLKQIYDPPVVLYMKGEVVPSDSNAVAIVGSRRPSIQGRLTAEKLALELASRGFTVASGMARGIDTASHRGALRAKGRTIGVLGSGLDVIYPPENKDLMGEISRCGAVLSEFPLGTKPNRENFPRRNRVVSGLSLGIVVVEAGEKSGSLITANFALEQGRDVFAVPGNVSLPTTRGCHRLIKEGARLVEKVEDILEELGSSDLVPADKKQSAGMPISQKEAEVYNLLKEEPAHIDELSNLAEMESYEISQLLVKLEIRGLARQLPGKLFVRR